MNLTNKLGLKVLGLVVVSLLLAVNCAEEGTAPDANLPPNTFITNYQIDIGPDSATAYMAKISWSGNDVDGAIFWYEWAIINANGDSLEWEVENDTGGVDVVNISTWQSTNVQELDIKLDYPDFDTRYIFRVRAMDNDRTIDPTPAVDTVSINRIRDFNYAPNTEIVTGPPNGALCGQGVNFLIRGTDIDGVVSHIELAIDGVVDTTIATDITTGTLNYIARDLATGARTLTFKAIDNFDKVDPTPTSVSFTVVDTLAPELEISVPDGFNYWVPAADPQIDVTIEMTATVDFYYSYIDSFRVVTSSTQYVITEPTLTLEGLGADDYTLNVTAYDAGGSSTSTGVVNFSVNALTPGHGVLTVNGVDWGTYGSSANNLWNNGVAWGNRNSYKNWNLMPAVSAGAAYTDSLLGTGTPPAWMFDTTYFKAVSWMWNSYAGDDDFWYDDDTQAAVLNYLQNGGNIILAGRLGHYLFEDDHTEAFAEYCNYTSSVTGLVANSAVAVNANMSDMARNRTMSFTECVTVGHANVTELFQTEEGDPNLGWVIMPNGEGGGGAVCYVGGRCYGWDNATFKTNIDYILETFFGVSN